MHCYVNITHDFHENQPLLLRHNSSEFLYPRIFSPSIFDLTSGKPEIRVACPTDVLVVNNHTLGFGTAFLRCHGIWDFTIAGSMVCNIFICSEILKYFMISNFQQNVENSTILTCIINKYFVHIDNIEFLYLICSLYTIATNSIQQNWLF